MGKKKPSKPEAKKKTTARVSPRPAAAGSAVKGMPRSGLRTIPRNAAGRSGTLRVDGSRRLVKGPGFPGKASGKVSSTPTTGKSPKRAPETVRAVGAARIGRETQTKARGKTATKVSIQGRERRDDPRTATRTASNVSPPKTPMRKLPSGELAQIRELLARKKQAITNHLQTELVELEKPEKRHRADLEEIASDTHDTDSLCEIMDIEASQIDQIDLALTKIDNGTYGVCEDCGQEIPLLRLEALPFASQCIGCKRRAEIAGQIAASDSSPGAQ